MDLVWPSAEQLPSYISALKRGWSPDTRRPETAQDELARIAADPVRFIEEQVDREAKGPPIIQPDGRSVTRLPGYRRWMWDGEFCGAIDFRWQPGTTDLPPTCLGHIGYSVVPWKQRRGYATRALALLLPDVAGEGMPFVELTTEVANVASQRVIEANGGRLHERFLKPENYGGAESLRYRIVLLSSRA
jgi:predicted acetyltransferase